MFPDVPGRTESPLHALRRKLRRAMNGRVLAWEITAYEVGRFHPGDHLFLGYETVQVWRINHQKDTLYVW